MVRYTFDIPETPEAQTLLNLIIATGFFNEVEYSKIDNEKPKTPNKETIEAIEDANNNRTTEVIVKTDDIFEDILNS